MDVGVRISPNEMRRSADEAAGMMRALANSSRLLILCQLVEEQRTVGEIETALGLSQAYVSQQLARLREEHLVAATRDGRQMRYRIADPRLLPVIEVLYREFCVKGSKPAE